MNEKVVSHKASGEINKLNHEIKQGYVGIAAFDAMAVGITAPFSILINNPNAYAIMGGVAGSCIAFMDILILKDIHKNKRERAKMQEAQLEPGVTVKLGENSHT